MAYSKICQLLRHYSKSLMQKQKSLLVGTTKGLIEIKQSSGDWNIERVHFLGMPVSYVYIDPYTNTWWASLAHRHWGQKLHFSNDNGTTWESVSPPHYPSEATLSSGKKATLKKIWSIHAVGPNAPGEIWVGTEPGGLFISKKKGTEFELVEGLWNHPSRHKETQWFGAGRDHPFIHSIVVDPRDSDHVYIAVSCAGVFETKDGGQNWEPKNQGLIAAYLPNPHVEVGHDPHLVLACKANPDVLWQQNHCGIFRSTNGGSTWDNVTDSNGLANYGFALANDHNDPERAWVIPAISDEIRVAADLSLCVCRTDDGGKTWQEYRNGLPQGHAFDIAFRHALDIDGNTLAFGTTTGNLFVSGDFGENWSVISHHLARIDCVTFC